MFFLFFFFNHSATSEIYTLSLHDALPIWDPAGAGAGQFPRASREPLRGAAPRRGDRKSTRLNSSHPSISYAVFCLKKKIIKPHFRLLLFPFLEKSTPSWCT